MIDHGVGDLDEARNVGAGKVIAFLPELFSGIQTGLMDIDHDGPQPMVHFLPSPSNLRTVLGHFEAGARDASRIGGFARGIQNGTFQKQVHGCLGGRHIGALGDTLAPVIEKVAGVLNIQFIFTSADLQKTKIFLLDKVTLFFMAKDITK